MILAEGGAISLSNVVLDNSSGQINIAADGLFGGSGTISGGVISGEEGAQLFGGTFVDLTTTGVLTVGTGASTGNAAISGTITNEGEITFQQDNSNQVVGLDQELNVFTGEASLAGGGTVRFNGSETGIVGSGTNDSSLTNVDNTIRGNGGIQEITLINQGTIRAEDGVLTVSSVDFTQAAGRFEVAEDSVFDVSSSSVAIEGGIISGSGTILGDIFNEGGTLSPGDSIADPGTLALEGDFTHGIDSTLLIEIAGIDNGEFDVFDVTGEFNILGGDLQVGLLSGDFLIPESTRIDVLFASDGISGAFASAFLPTDSSGDALFSVDLETPGVLSLVALQDIQGTAVPEPSAGLMLCGLTSLLLSRRRRSC